MYNGDSLQHAVSVLRRLRLKNSSAFRPNKCRVLIKKQSSGYRERELYTSFEIPGTHFARTCTIVIYIQFLLIGTEVNPATSAQKIYNNRLRRHFNVQKQGATRMGGFLSKHRSSLYLLILFVLYVPLSSSNLIDYKQATLFRFTLRDLQIEEGSRVEAKSIGLHAFVHGQNTTRRNGWSFDYVLIRACTYRWNLRSKAIHSNRIVNYINERQLKFPSQEQSPLK